MHIYGEAAQYKPSGFLAGSLPFKQQEVYKCAYTTLSHAPTASRPIQSTEELDHQTHMGTGHGRWNYLPLGNLLR
jgi:hypothetical protein